MSEQLRAIESVGFLGLGNVGGKLAGSLLRNGFVVNVFDIDASVMDAFVERGATAMSSPKHAALKSDAVITCLPNPEASAHSLEGSEGILAGMSEPNSARLWMEMSTTDQQEVLRLGEKVASLGNLALDCPVSGGCHRAATGNISIFAGGERAAFDLAFPLLKVMGRRILHTGGLGSASVLKVVTNYLATANLVSLCEALVTAKCAGMDLATSYEAIRISSGNSFVHETESQVILNGSRDINFTMDLVCKDVGLFQEIAERAGVPLELSPLLVQVFKDGQARYGAREWSPNIIRRLEEACDVKVLATGFPAEMTDDEPEEEGHEVVATRG